MPRMSAADAARTAELILDTATEHFASQSYAEVSLESIAAGAGVTRGAVYHHYSSKNKLFAAVAARLHSRIADAVARAAAGARSDSFAAIKAGSHAFLDAITAGPAARVLLIEAPAVIGWDAWRDLDAQGSQKLLEEGLREMGIGEGIVEALTIQLSGAMNEAAIWVARQKNRRVALKKAHEALDVLLAVLERE
ncbi:MAG: TetR family transcriptional regulator [Actinomycetaceae bacterium]|nr:TetR family transcriptional regulator [Actinomycetaceae bacterium]